MRRAPVTRLSMIVTAALACLLASAASASATALGDGGSADPGQYQNDGWSGPDPHYDGSGDRRRAYRDPWSGDYTGDQHWQWRHRDGDWSGWRYSSAPDRAGRTAPDGTRPRPSATPRSTPSPSPSRPVATPPPARSGVDLAAADTRTAPATPPPAPGARTHRSDPARGVAAPPHRTVIAPRPQPTAQVALAANTEGPHDSSGLGPGSLARYGEIGAGVLAVLLATAALVLWRRDRGVEE